MGSVTKDAVNMLVISTRCGKLSTHLRERFDPYVAIRLGVHRIHHTYLNLELFLLEKKIGGKHGIVLGHIPHFPRQNLQSSSQSEE